MADLTTLQKAFLAAYLGPAKFNGTEAAALAGYSGDRHVLSVTAAQNLGNPRIAAAIATHIEEIMPAGEVLTVLADQARGSGDDIISFRTERRPTTVTKPLGEIIEELGAAIAFEEAYAARAELRDPELADLTAQLASLRRRIIRMELELERDPAATGETAGPMIEEQVPYIDLEKCKRLGRMHLIKSFNAKDGKVELYDAQSAAQLLGKHHALFTDRVELGKWTPDKAAKLTDDEIDAELEKRGVL